MNQTERDTANYITALQGSAPLTVNGHCVRRVTIESLGVLQLIGSPFAAAFQGALSNKTAAPRHPGPLDIAVLAWAHAEDPDTVLSTALQCAPGMEEPAYRAALSFTRGWSVQDMVALLDYATAEVSALQASNFDTAAPESHAKKNPASGAPASSLS